MVRIHVDRERLVEFCRRNRIRRLALFGSVLRDHFGPESDVDVLVEFEPDCTPGFRYVDIEDELSRMFGRRVDLETPGSLSDYFRNDVLRGAVDQYVAG
ncbi:MAG: nucleotidyltransferase family protein [Planctomycetes bacterium]|nr:nucleotidyltransferase family protein [Planctomycetota bacterium]